MTWAEILALFNFIAWILPIAIRSWIAWRIPSGSTNILSSEEHFSISRAVSNLNLRGKKIKLGDGAKTDRDIQEGSK